MDEDADLGAGRHAVAPADLGAAIDSIMIAWRASDEPVLRWLASMTRIAGPVTGHSHSRTSECSGGYLVGFVYRDPASHQWGFVIKVHDEIPLGIAAEEQIQTAIPALRHGGVWWLPGALEPDSSLEHAGIVHDLLHDVSSTAATR